MRRKELWEMSAEDQELLKPDPELSAALARQEAERTAKMWAGIAASCERKNAEQAARLPTLKPKMRVNGYRIVRDESDAPGVYHVLAEDGTAFYTGRLGRCKTVATECEPSGPDIG